MKTMQDETMWYFIIEVKWHYNNDEASNITFNSLFFSSPMACVLELAQNINHYTRLGHEIISITICQAEEEEKDSETT